MITLLRQLKSWQVALIAATLLSLILATNPLVGLHGLEAGLILSIVLGPFAAFGGARAAIFARSSGTPIPLNELYRQCFALALMMWVIPAIILALNALRVTQCAPGIGLVYMLLGPGMSLGICVLGGALVALALPFDRLSSVLAPLIPLAGIAHGLYRLWSSPAIYSYVHAVGYAPGTIYDEGLHIPEAYFSFRALTIMLMTGLVLLGHALIDADSLRTTQETDLKVIRLRKGVEAWVIRWSGPGAEPLNDRAARDSGLAEGQVEVGAVNVARAGRCQV